MEIPAQRPMNENSDSNMRFVNERRGNMTIRNLNCILAAFVSFSMSSKNQKG